MTVNEAVVAEVHYDRNASAEQLRALGQALLGACRANAWIARMTGLDSLLRGECSQHFSKGIARKITTETGGERYETEPFYDPILVWGRVPCPVELRAHPVEVLSAAVPAGLGRVTIPDPSGGA